MLTAARRGLRMLSTVNMSKRLEGVPIAKKVAENLYFGVNPEDPEEFRGNHAMDPPKVRQDFYNWLRDDDRKDPEVLAHLAAENKYAEEQQAHLAGLREELYNEMLSHLKETDEDVPHRDGDYLYYSKTQQGKAYKIHCRKPLSDSTVETVVIDENKLAEGHDYSDLSTFAVSPSHNLVAYTIDHSGYETYDMHIIKDIETGEESADVLKEIDGSVTWGADDSTLFYLKMDEEHRPYKLFMHILGTPQSEDVCIFTEDDGMFWMDVGKSADDKFLFFSTESKETSEVHVINLQGIVGADGHRTAAQQSVCLRKREFGVRYEGEHHEGLFYVITNIDGAKNNKLSCCPVSAYYNVENMTPVSEYNANYTDMGAYDPSRQIDDIQPFRSFIVVFGRQAGLPRLWIINKDPQSEQYDRWEEVSFPEVAYSIWSGDNYVYDCNTLRLGFSSFLTPKQVIDYDMVTGSRNILKQVEVPKYEPEKYECRRIEATVRDGTKVPLSMVFNKKMLNAGGELRDCPLLLYGYGSYGSCIDPSFDFKRTAMLDRGVIYVIAHIRGGGEMGKAWYEDEGKYLTKLNTFHDFIDCGQFLVDQGITRSDRLAVVGRSAGGLLIGAVCNMRPELFKAAVADVPFVDAVNTMSDPTIPLTVTEWEEWGNPNEEKYLDYMLKYSPYDNVRAQDYPSILITAGLNDPRVAYWEPAKWCAKLRETKTDSNLLLLKTDMSSGHFSASDRYKYIKETAFEYAFILEQINATKIV